MAKLSRIANVVISLNTTGITELSFSDGMIFGVTGAFLPRRIEITGADELLEMGVASTDPLYIAASNWFSGIPASRKLHVGRWKPSAHVITVSDTIKEGDKLKVSISYKTAGGDIVSDFVEYTAAASATPTSAATGLAAAITGKAWPLTGVAAAGAVTVSATGDGDIALKVEGKATISYTAPTETVAEGLAAANGNWYGLIMASRVRADVEAAARWAEANEKLFGSATVEPGAKDASGTTDLLAWGMQNQLFRSFFFYDDHAASQYPEATLMSEMFTFYPGQETWALKKLPGIAYSDLKEGEASAIFAKNGNSFELFRNFAVTQNGKVAAGEWIDVIRLRDQLAESIRVSVVSAMINANGKIPYTDGGIAVIDNAVRQPLDLNVRRGGIAPPELDENDNIIPSYIVNVPLSANVPFNDKANRILNDVKFSARLAGAIHVVEIKGALSYTL